MAMNDPGAGDPGATQPEGEPSDGIQTDPATFTREYVKGLRNEGARYRTRNKELSAENVDLRRGLMFARAAAKHGVTDDAMDFLEFSMRRDGRWSTVDPQTDDAA